MDILLHEGDHAVHPNGLPVQISNKDLLLQQALLRLSIPQGAFPYDKDLGSSLHKLIPGSPQIQQTARNAVEVALKFLPQVKVQEVFCRFPFPEQIFLNVSLEIENTVYPISLEVI